MERILTIFVFVLLNATYAYEAIRLIQQNNYRLPRLARIVGGAERFAVIYALLAVSATVSVYLSYKIGELLPTIILPIAFVSYNVTYFAKQRTRLKFTKRAVRQTAITVCFFAALQCVFYFFISEIYLYALASYLLTFAAKGVSILVFLLIKPLESLNNARYIKRAAAKLEGLSAIKIAITGSFGKTSCKNILCTMLSYKYKVFATPSNFNTPLGIARAAKDLTGDEDVFIAELGARYRGDIKELCAVVKPKYAILSGVCGQHLESFGSEENVYLTKKELIDCLPQDGYAVFNGDNAHAVRMTATCNCDFDVANTIKQEGIYAENVKLSSLGCNFTLHGIGEPFDLSTRLLGRHNVQNVVMCAALAFRLGLSREEIKEAVGNLKSVPHRLELINGANGITIIDDSYNANLVGAGYALEVLSQFGGRKVVFSQGIVELGSKQKETNELLGKLIAGIADAAIVAGENADSICNGLIKSGFDAGLIYKYKDFEAARSELNKILKSKDILLIQNDLP